MNAENQQTGDPIQRKVTVPRPKTNRRSVVSIVSRADSPDEKIVEIEPISSGSPGVYRATFILGVPGKQVFHSDIDLQKFLESGESLLVEPRKRIVGATLINNREKVDVFFAPNADGVFARAQVTVNAETFQTARNTAIDLVMPILSSWSFVYDVALDVVGHAIVEEATGTINFSFGVVGQKKVFELPPISLSKPEYRAIFSAYREGAGALNVFYQFLCFFKVAEGAKRIRNQRRTNALTSGREFREPGGEQVPAAENDIDVEPSEQQRFSSYLGMKFTRVLDELRGVLRNALAHLDPAKSLVADKADDIARCEQAIPVIRYIARVMVEHELEADPDLVTWPAAFRRNVEMSEQGEP